MIRMARFGEERALYPDKDFKMGDDHPTTDADNEDEYGKVETGQPDPKPASGEPVESDEFAHANDDD